MPIVEKERTGAIQGPSLGLVQHVADRLRARTDRATLASAIDAAGVPHPFQSDVDTQITVHQEAAFVEAACDHAGDVDFALEAGVALQHATTLPGYISEHSRTLRDALLDAARFLPLVRPGFDFRLEEPGNMASLSLEISDPLLFDCPRYVEVLYAGVIGQIRTFTARPFHPEDLSFRHDRRSVSAAIRSEIGSAVTFDAERTEMLLDPRALARPIRDREDALRGLLVQHGELLEGHADRHGLSFAERVELFIQRTLPTGLPDVDTTASALGVSRRTLSRKLADAETRFVDILNRVRMKVAIHELRESDRPIGEIAWRLGYASQSSFTTAFRKETGMSPRDFRRNGG